MLIQIVGAGSNGRDDFRIDNDEELKGKRRDSGYASMRNEMPPVPTRAQLTISRVPTHCRIASASTRECPVRIAATPRTNVAARRRRQSFQHWKTSAWARHRRARIATAHHRSSE